MPTVIVKPIGGCVDESTLTGSTKPAATAIVGSAPQWGDNSDSSYVDLYDMSSAALGPSVHAQLEPAALPPGVTVTNVEVLCRCQTITSATDARINAYTTLLDADGYPLAFGNEVSADYFYTTPSASWVTAGTYWTDAAVADLVSGAYIAANISSPDSTAMYGRIFELWVRITYQGRVKINIGTTSSPVWKYCVPVSGENGGAGRLKVNIGSSSSPNWIYMTDGGV